LINIESFDWVRPKGNKTSRWAQAQSHESTAKYWIFFADKGSQPTFGNLSFHSFERRDQRGLPSSVLFDAPVTRAYLADRHNMIEGKTDYPLLQGDREEV